jgi:dTDP-4-amino-4,6-dideoxygalactose transaminase
MTHSCTAALEIAAILAGIQPGDEVIMPSFTFVSTALAFVMRGGVPVFVDVDRRTFNIDPQLAADAVTPRTKAIVVVHYAGISCDMSALAAVARQHNLLLIEDAAHALMSSYRGVPVGRRGHLSALSFHETKNIICGEGGALLVNDERFRALAEQIAEKGTDRARFFRGEVDKYTWRTLGSSYFPSDLNGAFLWAQLQAAEEITARRLSIWNRYQEAFRRWTEHGVQLPYVDEDCVHNGHIYFLVLPTAEGRARFIAGLSSLGIKAVFHYVPLHSSPGGVQYGRASGELPVTKIAGERLVRLPLWVGLEEHLERVIAGVNRTLEQILC